MNVRKFQPCNIGIFNILERRKKQQSYMKFYFFSTLKCIEKYSYFFLSSKLLKTDSFNTYASFGITPFPCNQIIVKQRIFYISISLLSYLLFFLQPTTIRFPFTLLTETTFANDRLSSISASSRVTFSDISTNFCQLNSCFFSYTYAL